MSITAVSPPPQYVGPSPIADPRLQTNEGEGNNCWTTAMKVIAVIAGVIASIASFIFSGPLVGLVTTLALGAGALLIFNSCCGSSHNQRVLSFIPTGGVYTAPHAPAPHVPVGQGHISSPVPSGGHPYAPHVLVGGGHNQPPHAGSIPPAHHGHGGSTSVPPPTGLGGRVIPGAGHF